MAGGLLEGYFPMSVSIYLTQNTLQDIYGQHKRSFTSFTNPFTNVNVDFAIRILYFWREQVLF